METNIKQGKCGGCGNDKYMVYTNGNGEVITVVFVQCTQCNSISIISQVPRLEIKWGDDASGLLNFKM